MGKNKWSIRIYPDTSICLVWSKNMASKNAFKLSGGLKELRLHICQKSPASAGARQFVERHYVPIKMSNPKFPILVRECSGIQPRLWARYGYGREESLDLTNKSAEDVVTAIEMLNK